MSFLCRGDRRGSTGDGSLYRCTGTERVMIEHEVPRAVAMLAHHRTPDVRVLPVFKEIMAEEDDRKLRLHAGHGLKRYADAGLPV